MAEKEKPPLGLTPRNIAAGLRAKEITDAMTRYSEQQKVIPLEWIVELEYLLDKHGLGDFDFTKA
jgi:hypothetical protein